MRLSLRDYYGIEFQFCMFVLLDLIKILLRNNYNLWGF